MARFTALGHVLRRCHQANIAAWSATFGPGPTAPQHAVLTAVAAAGKAGADMQCIATVAGLEKTTLTGVARRLERDALLVRRPDPADRRRQLLTLSEEGLRTVRDAAERAAAAQAAFLAPVAAEGHDRLLRHLRELSGVPTEPPPQALPALEAWRRLTATPGHLIRRAQQAHTAHWLAAFGQELTGPQYAVLRLAGLLGETTQTRIGEAAALDKATLSGVVERLIQRDLLLAQPDPSDRRARLLSLTLAGRRTEEDARDRVRQVQLKTSEPVAVGDRLWLQDVLEQLAFPSGMPEVGLEELAI